jgi:hypothetical protein
VAAPAVRRQAMSAEAEQLANVLLTLRDARPWARGFRLLRLRRALGAKLRGPTPFRTAASMDGPSVRSVPSARGGSSNGAPQRAAAEQRHLTGMLRSAAAHLLNPRKCNALHAAKLLTAAMLAALAATRPGGAAGVASSLRCCTYLALHGSYLIWWFLHFLLAPGWCATLFPGDVGGARGLVSLVAVVGAAYALPGALALRNEAPFSPVAAAACTAAFVLGSLTNAAADFYKAGAKDSGAGAGAVTGGPYTHLAHPNWLGDWIRYAALAAVAGHPAAFAVPAYIVYRNFSLQAARRRAAQAAGKAR